MKRFTIVLLAFLVQSVFTQEMEKTRDYCGVEDLKCIEKRIKKNEFNYEDLNRQDGNGRTSLHYAVEAKNLELIKVILSNYSNLATISDFNGNLPIHRAAQVNSREILDVLLSYSQSELNRVDRNGETVLDIAQGNGFYELTSYLKSRGGKVGKTHSSSTTLWLYGVYVLISCIITIWVAQTFFKNGRIFLLDAFHSTELADSVNHLLVVGFYLINLGYITIALKIGSKPEDNIQAVEILSFKLGLVILILGFMHFFNLYLFGRLRKRTLLKKELGLDKNVGVVRPVS
ncbi:MAG TPA: ankyrin repeat domain-containing protein [Leptospiraceae bacterium]|nr:ankyrin repeat domain-containing protein [Leptospiraceae bacterium]HMX34326.1 ankyrin repeat domain-containing protein [Leptospiraceae bacterium]HMY33077.1 ankyrin repeat domain-containing protein [Leptospiraceae bacterium]HMZ65545.1 ankyrin repeat domain-containing protein [Leptospiraceae bacterium]HNA09579.1 ankyrin repeat domain-containing protein [Leptospiraceae bacterium]